MKKNITINLAGQLFAIDEDAYNLLLNYTETLRRYYRRQDEGEEVVDDIEGRIAELFSELNTRGYSAITIEHVQSIIERIGQPEDITDGTSSTTAGTTHHDGLAATDGTRSAGNETRSARRFYRDSENKVLAGVLAGCARYFGGDVVFWRIVFLLLVFVPLPFIGDFFAGISGAAFIAYIIVAIVAPSATTPEARLKMSGREVNPQNLAEEVSRQNAAYAADPAGVQRRDAIATICAILLIIFSVWAWLGFIGVLCGAGVFAIVPEFAAHNIMPDATDAEMVSTVCHGILLILSAIAVNVFVVAYCTLHAGLSILDKVKSMTFVERIVWFVVWVVSCVAIVMASVHFAATIDKDSLWENGDDEAPAVVTESTAVDPDTVAVDIDTVSAIHPVDKNSLPTPASAERSN